MNKYRIKLTYDVHPFYPNWFVQKRFLLIFWVKVPGTSSRDRKEVLNHLNRLTDEALRAETRK